MKNFTLQIGETKEYQDDHGNIYHISADRFSEHDHLHKAVYHPLQEFEDPAQIVLTVECESDGYPSPYSCCIQKYWGVLRQYIMFDFDLLSNEKATFIQCHVRNNPIGKKKIFGDPKNW